MITRLEFENFRGLKHVVLDDLRSVNLIVGGNDTGKTSVLEGLILLLGNSNSISQLPLTFRTNQSSEDDRINFWPWLFHDRNPALPTRIQAEIDSHPGITVATQMLAEGNYPGSEAEPVLVRSDERDRDENLVLSEQLDRQRREVHLLRLSTNRFYVGGSSEPPRGFRVSVLSTRAPNPVADAENYNQIALQKDGEARMERIMRGIEPRLERLRYAKLQWTNSPLIFVDLGLSQAVPAPQMGQAFNRILHIYTNILVNRTNVLLIDEIENGIFSESMPTLWKGLLTICREQGVQIFATTHSRECVMAAHRAASGRGDNELSVQRLQLVNGQVEAVRLGAEHLEVAEEMGLEVRS
jgi:predicted ATPase